MDAEAEEEARVARERDAKRKVGPGFLNFDMEGAMEVLSQNPVQAAARDIKRSSAPRGEASVIERLRAQEAARVAQEQAKIDAYQRGLAAGRGGGVDGAAGAGGEYPRDVQWVEGDPRAGKDGAGPKYVDYSGELKREEAEWRYTWPTKSDAKYKAKEGKWREVEAARMVGASMEGRTVDAEARREGLEGYAALKRRLLSTTAVCSAFGTAYAGLQVSEDAALSFFLGSLGALYYTFSLIREVDSMTIAQGGDQARALKVAPPRLLVPVLLFAFWKAWNARHGELLVAAKADGNDALAFLAAHDAILPALITGFFAYTPARFLQISQDLKDS